MSDWQTEFRSRMRRFEAAARHATSDEAVSIKVRVLAGCFHREHSPNAYEMIDSHLSTMAPDEVRSLMLEEHESGPEVLVWMAVTTAGLTLAKSVVDLVTTIIKARSEGVRRGDRPAEPVELIVRRLADDDVFLEERILRIGHDESVRADEIEASLTRALEKLKADGEEDRTDLH